MIKYSVVSYDGKDCIYSGFSESNAYRLQRNYNRTCGEWYVDEEDIEGDALYQEFQLLSEEELAEIYSNETGETLTSLSDFWDWAEEICYS